MRCGKRPSGADADAVDFHQEQLPSEEFPVRLAVDEPTQVGDELRNDFRVVVQLQRKNAAVAGRWVGDNVGEIPVQREKEAIQFLSFGDDQRIRRADGKVFPQRQDFMALELEELNDLQRDALVSEEPKFHAAAMASKSARSRAKSRQADTSAAVRSGN